MDSKGKILEALNSLMKEVKFAPKEKNPNLKYEIVTYDGLLDEVRDKAIAHGLVLIPSGCQHTNCTPYERQGYENKTIHMKCDSYIFTFTLWHSSGESLTVQVPAIGVDEQDKGPGKAMTYAAKYAWLQVMMLKRGDDPDQEPSAQHQRPAAAPQRQQPVQQPQQQQRPSNAAQQPVSGKLTDNPATWPPEWQKALETAKNSAKDANAIQLDKDFKIMVMLTKVKEMVMGRNAPDIILNEFMHQIAGWMLNSAMKTIHAQETCKSVLENWALFEEYIGVGSEKAKTIKQTLTDYVPW